MDSKKIGEFIKKQRTEKNMTQEELAAKLYVSNKTISKWETGKGIPSVDMLVPLAKILDVNIAEILGGKKAIKEEEVLIKELKNKKKNNIINLISGIFICLFLCFLESVLYLSEINSKYGYIILGGFILVLLVMDIANYFRNK